MGLRVLYNSSKASGEDPTGQNFGSGTPQSPVVRIPRAKISDAGPPRAQWGGSHGPKCRKRGPPEPSGEDPTGQNFGSGAPQSPVVRVPRAKISEPGPPRGQWSGGHGTNKKNKFLLKEKKRKKK